MRQREVTAKLSERTMRAQSELEGYPADEDQGDLDRRLDRVLDLDRRRDLHLDPRLDPPLESSLDPCLISSRKPALQ